VIRKALRNKDIKVDGVRRPAEYMLQQGELLRAFLPESPPIRTQSATEAAGTAGEICVIHEDENILILDKPAGLLCHDQRNAGLMPGCAGFSVQDTLINRVRAYLHGEFAALCNRIDRNTSGLVIAAKNAETLRGINEKLRLRQITRLYLCILTAVPAQKEATLTAYLEKDEATNTVRITDRKTPANKTIITKYRVLKERGNLALAEIELVTGRTHQIRAHMAHIGCPLLGDGKYGRNRVNKLYGFDKQALCSYKLTYDGETFVTENVWFSELWEKISQKP
jgi:23S rRNA pseudouridine955/2504/2580 synthase